MSAIGEARRRLTIADLKPRPAMTRSGVAAPPGPAKPRGVVRDVDGFPIGWCSDHHSWEFQRALWVDHEICLAFGEYSLLSRQCRPSRGGGERLADRVWRVTLRSGLPIVVGVSAGWRAAPVALLSGEAEREAWLELQRAQADARAAQKKQRASV